MPMRIPTVAFFMLFGLCAPRVAVAQTPPAQTGTSSDDLKVSVYPILLWAPFFSATTVVPAFPDVPNGPDLPGGTGSTSPSLNGAALAGIAIEKGVWRVDAEG